MDRKRKPTPGRFRSAWIAASVHLPHLFDAEEWERRNPTYRRPWTLRARLVYAARKIADGWIRPGAENSMTG